MPKVLVPFAERFKEIEAITIVDILRPAGAEVCIAALEKRNVRGSEKVAEINAGVLANLS
ncbi:MAG: hypothetical protein L3J79_08100 [Candidatus Marinimicrobia bacterium]|nr:hypothetical protein [Candidatus Neomarinimicrobiota bacterium]